MKVTTLLPMYANDAQPFTTTKLNEILDSLTAQFGGCSTDGRVDGRSLENGINHRDVSLRVTIVCDKERLLELQARIIEIGRDLGQIRMYFEVRDYDGVQFLTTI